MALLVFGPSKLPEIGKSLGKSFREFKKGTTGFMESLDKESSEPEVVPEALPRPDAKVTASPVSQEEDVEEVVIKVEEPTH